MRGNAANLGIRRVSTLSDDDPDRAIRSRGHRSGSSVRVPERPGARELRTEKETSAIAALVRSAAIDIGVDTATRLVAVFRTSFDRIAAPIRQIEADEILAAFPAN